MLGAAVIDGSANFGIAFVLSFLSKSRKQLTSCSHSCAMYRTISPTATIEMWPIAHNTIAGDVAVTTFIQVR